jgi:hypothetical protein
VVLGAAFLNHLFAVKRKGSALQAVDHIHYAPGLSAIYARAEKGYFDPYGIGWKAADWVAKVSFRWDRMIDWLYDGFTVRLTDGLACRIRRLHTGNYSLYVVWSLIGLFLVTIFLMYAV